MSMRGQQFVGPLVIGATMSEQKVTERDDKMDKAIEVAREDIGFVKELILQARLVWRLLWDPEV